MQSFVSNLDMIADVVLLTYRYNKPSYAVTFIDSFRYRIVRSRKLIFV